MTKIRSVCAEFSPIKIGVPSSNNGTSPAIVTHNKSHKKIGPCALTWRKNRSDFFLGAACDKKSVVSADSVCKKMGHSLRLFLGAPHDNKSVRMRWPLGCI